MAYVSVVEKLRDVAANIQEPYKELLNQSSVERIIEEIDDKTNKNAGAKGLIAGALLAVLTALGVGKLISSYMSEGMSLKEAMQAAHVSTSEIVAQARKLHQNIMDTPVYDYHLMKEWKKRGIVFDPIMEKRVELEMNKRERKL